MRCPKCGHDNLDGVYYCAGCLHPIGELAQPLKPAAGQPGPQGEVLHPPWGEVRIAHAEQAHPEPQDESAPTTDHKWIPAAALEVSPEEARALAAEAEEADLEQLRPSMPETDRKWLYSGVSEVTAEEARALAAQAEEADLEQLRPMLPETDHKWLYPEAPELSPEQARELAAEAEEADLEQLRPSISETERKWVPAAVQEVTAKEARTLAAEAEEADLEQLRQSAPDLSPPWQAAAPAPTAPTAPAPKRGPRPAPPKPPARDDTSVKIPMRRTPIGVAVFGGLLLVGVIFALGGLVLSSKRDEQARPRDDGLAKLRRPCEARSPSQCAKPDRACRQAGNACNSLGWAYQKGVDAPRNSAQAARWFRRACQLGSPAGCDSLGFMLLNGQGVSGNEQQALALFRRACGDGLRFGCLNEGLMLYLGRGAPQDRARAARLFAVACQDQGDWTRYCQRREQEECGSWALLTAIGGCGEPDTAAARKWLPQACSGGYDWMCERFREVLTVAGGARGGEQLAPCTPDRPDACEAQCRRFEPGQCSGGDRGCMQAAAACNRLGWIYQKGKAVERNAATAARWFKRSCELGSASGCDSLGFMLQNGQGVERDEGAALRLFTAACQAGLKYACLNQGLMLHFGRGAERNISVARSLFQLGCSQAKNWMQDCKLGRQEECGTGALLAAIGVCGFPNRPAAERWLPDACAGGYSWPCERYRQKFGKQLLRRGRAAEPRRKPAPPAAQPAEPGAQPRPQPSAPRADEPSTEPPAPVLTPPDDSLTEL